MKRICMISLAMCGLLVALMGNAYGSVSYTATDVGPNGDGMELWQYDFSILNSTADKNFNEFFVYFDYGLCFSLNDLSTNPQWTTAVVEPYLNGNSDPVPGFFNAQIISGNRGPDESASGFSVQFVSSAPSVQIYEFYDGGNLMESGTSTVATTPEPTTWVLLSLSLGTVFALRRKLLG